MDLFSDDVSTTLLSGPNDPRATCSPVNSLLSGSGLGIAPLAMSHNSTCPFGDLVATSEESRIAPVSWPRHLRAGDLVPQPQMSTAVAALGASRELVPKRNEHEPPIGAELYFCDLGLHVAKQSLPLPGSNIPKFKGFAPPLCKNPHAIGAERDVRQFSVGTGKNGPLLTGACFPRAQASAERPCQQKPAVRTEQSLGNWLLVVVSKYEAFLA